MKKGSSSFNENKVLFNTLLEKIVILFYPYKRDANVIFSNFLQEQINKWAHGN